MRELVMAGDSVIGTRYRANFDRVHTDPVRRLAVVADGMGDGVGSETAGRVAVEVFLSSLPTGPGPQPGVPAAQRDQALPGSLRRASAEVQRSVLAAGRDLPGLTGCTLTALVAGADDAWIVHLGDSRVYRLRDSLLELLTTDHTVAWLGAVHGWFPFDSPEAHAARYRLLRYAGHPDAPEPDLLNVSLRPGDQYLLCTDGLAEQVAYERITAVLGRPGVPEAKAAELLADSLAAGGKDNATAVVIEVR